jgi:hypothetical protein
VVTIIGRNLEHASQVTINRAPATIVSDIAFYLVAIVPDESTTVWIAITTPAGTVEKNGWSVVTVSRRAQTGSQAQLTDLRSVAEHPVKKK